MSMHQYTQLGRIRVPAEILDDYEMMLALTADIVVLRAEWDPCWQGLEYIAAHPRFPSQTRHGKVAVMGGVLHQRWTDAGPRWRMEWGGNDGVITVARLEQLEAG